VELIANKNPAIKNLSRALLATTCLTAASGISGATTITEGQDPAPTDFGNTLGTATLLPFGTTTVFGSLNAEGDRTDFFEFQSLAGGQAFTVSGLYNPFGQEAGTYILPFDSSGTPISVEGLATGGSQAGFGSLEGSGAVLNGTIPADGIIIVEVNVPMFDSAPTYEVDLTANTVPEPSTLVTAGLALAGGLAWRRKRSRKA
jgi:hypothetical protein